MMLSMRVATELFLLTYFPFPCGLSFSWDFLTRLPEQCLSVSVGVCGQFLICLSQHILSSTFSACVNEIKLFKCVRVGRRRFLFQIQG